MTVCGDIVSLRDPYNNGPRLSLVDMMENRRLGPHLQHSLPPTLGKRRSPLLVIVAIQQSSERNRWPLALGRECRHARLVRTDLDQGGVHHLTIGC